MKRRDPYWLAVGCLLAFYVTAVILGVRADRQCPSNQAISRQGAINQPDPGGSPGTAQ